MGILPMSEGLTQTHGQDAVPRRAPQCYRQSPMHPRVGRFIICRCWPANCYILSTHGGMCLRQQMTCILPGLRGKSGGFVARYSAALSHKRGPPSFAARRAFSLNISVEPRMDLTRRSCNQTGIGFYRRAQRKQRNDFSRITRIYADWEPTPTRNLVLQKETNENEVSNVRRRN